MQGGGGGGGRDGKEEVGSKNREMGSLAKIPLYLKVQVAGEPSINSSLPKSTGSRVAQHKFLSAWPINHSQQLHNELLIFQQLSLSTHFDIFPLPAPLPFLALAPPPLPPPPLHLP